MEASASGGTFRSRLNRRISSKAIKRFKNRIREITCRVRGRRIEIIVKKLRWCMLSWRSYFHFKQMRYVLLKSNVS